MAAALLVVPIALVQRDPKVVLAYSSIGKMGTMIAGLGVAAMEPGLAPAITIALLFYAAQHGFAKGALFLGVGIVKSSNQRWPLAALTLIALVLAHGKSVLPGVTTLVRARSWIRVLGHAQVVEDAADIASQLGDGGGDAIGTF